MPAHLQLSLGTATTHQNVAPQKSTFTVEIAFISLTGVTPVLDITDYKTCHSELEYDKFQVHEVKTADSLPFANQQQPNTSRDAKQVLTYKYKEQNGQIRIKEKIKKPEFTLTPIKTGEKTGLQKNAKVGTRRESPLSDDVVGTATSGTTTTPLDMLELRSHSQRPG